MKKALLYIIFCIVSISVHAQYIEHDKADQDGTRRITSTDLFVRNGFTDRNPFYYSITTRSTHKSIPDKGLLLIKTREGEIIESYNIYKEYETHDLRYLNLYGCYPMEIGDLEKIVSCGISKIRIEAPYGTIDTEYNDSKSKLIAKEFRNRLDCINEALSHKKTLRDGF